MHRPTFAIMAMAMALASCGDDTSSQAEPSQQHGDGDGDGDGDRIGGSGGDTHRLDSGDELPDGNVDEMIADASATDGGGALLDASFDASNPEQPDGEAPGSSGEAGAPDTSAPVEPPPYIETAAPHRVAPSQRLSITGVRLTAINTVWFGDLSVTPESISETMVLVTVPSLPFGLLEVSVESDVGRSNAVPLTIAAVPIIERLLPDDNPLGGPVLIRGQHLGNVQSVSFGGVPTDVTVFSDIEVAVHVPQGIALGMTDVHVATLEDVSGSAPFEVLDAYPPGPASPPDIVPLTRPNAGTFPPVTNAWSSTNCRYNLHFGCDGSKSPQPVEGTELCQGATTGTVSGQWDSDTLTVALSITRASGAERYEGAFVQSDYTLLALFSMATDRQLTFTIGARGFNQCDETTASRSRMSCACGDSYLCGDTFYIGQACFDRQCAKCDDVEP